MVTTGTTAGFLRYIQPARIQLSTTQSGESTGSGVFRMFIRMEMTDRIQSSFQARMTLWPGGKRNLNCMQNLILLQQASCFTGMSVSISTGVVHISGIQNTSFLTSFPDSDQSFPAFSSTDTDIGTPGRQPDLLLIKDFTRLTITKNTGIGAEEGAGRCVMIRSEPNPFRNSTAIHYIIPSCCSVTISIYDICGRLVRSLVNGFQKAGSHSIILNGTNNRNDPVTPGIYFGHMETDNDFINTGMLLLP